MRFILFVGFGNSLAESEVKNRISGAELVFPLVYRFEKDSVDEAKKLVSQLGSSLKLAKELVGVKVEPSSIASNITHKNFSITLLGGQPTKDQFLLQVKEKLERSRFIEAKDPFGLSPIIITKHKVDEFFIDTEKEIIYQTVWVHNFENWIKKDRRMPKINPKAGMLPPKIARSMINLLPIDDPEGKTLVDPFCGSGRILVEAAEMGYKVIGTDISNDQIADTKENLNFLGVDGQVLLHDATHLSEVVSQTDAIVTEPFLGKPNLRPDQVRFVAPGLEKLYLGSLKDWQKVLKPGGYVVMVFPIFKGPKNEYRTSRVIDDKHLLGYNQLTRGLVYSRPDADTKREIVVLQKTIK